MLLNYFSLTKILIVLVVSFVFIKIYQHNLVIKLNYERQRLENKKTQREKERNELSVQLLSLLEPGKLVVKAKEAWGMNAIKISQVRAVPPKVEVDFLGTTSSDKVLTTLELHDVVMGYTGR